MHARVAIIKVMVTGDISLLRSSGSGASGQES